MEDSYFLADKSVAICGLGGLGSSIALTLVRAGVKRLHCIDFDRVDALNIHRQQYFLRQIGKYKTEAIQDLAKEINPNCKVRISTEKITLDNMQELLCADDLICEAFDNPKEKAMLVNGVLELFPEKFLVAASGMAGFEDANAIHTRKIRDNFFLCGDEVSSLKKNEHLVASRVLVCAAHQAHILLQQLANDTLKRNFYEKQ